MSCQRNKSMLNDANKNDHECVFYIIRLEQIFYIDVLLRNMPTHNILNEKLSNPWNIIPGFYVSEVYTCYNDLKKDNGNIN